MPATIAASVAMVTTAFCATTSVVYRVTAFCRATTVPTATITVAASGARYPTRITAGRAHGWFGGNRSDSTNTAPQATEDAPTVFRKYNTGPGPPTPNARGGGAPPPHPAHPRQPSTRRPCSGSTTPDPDRRPQARVAVAQPPRPWYCRATRQR